MSINFHGERSAYRQLADLLRDLIDTGQVGPTGLLPSVATIGQRYGVGRETVRRALGVLREEGRIVVERGYGARVVDEQELEQVRVPRGGRVRSRMPTEQERADLGIEPGAVVPVLVVTLGGRARGVYRADRTVLTFS